MDRDRLLHLLAERSFQRGSFALASGVRSHFYIDARLTTMSPEGLRLIGRLGYRAIQARGWNPDSVGGLTLGADPVAYAIAYFSSMTDKPMRAFTVRKERKDHGTGRLIEGPFLSQDTCVVVEDVITTGASAVRAISLIREAGASVAGVLAIVDREEGGSAEIEKAGVPVVSLTYVSELARLAS